MFYSSIYVYLCVLHVLQFHICIFMYIICITFRNIAIILYVLHFPFFLIIYVLHVPFFSFSFLQYRAGDWQAHVTF